MEEELPNRVDLAEISYEEKVFIAERFLDAYAKAEARDVYRWLWEGEFGPGAVAPDLSLEGVVQHLRRARIHRRRTGLPVCENAGLANLFVKVNLAPYADAGCPLKRLLILEERVKDVRPDPLRFKRDWAFMKTQLIPGMSLTLEKMNQFEHEIPFHMAPEIEYSEIWKNEYGQGYRLAPRESFFQYFPEYEIINGWTRS